MKKIYTCFAILIFSTLTTFSQTQTEKTSTPVLNVITDLDEAKAKAKKENKPIFLEFMSSSCGHCQAFKKNVLSDESFITYANANLITVIHAYDELSTLTAPEKKNRKTLMEKLKISSFPSIFLISSKGKILLRKEGYNNAKAAKIITAFKQANK